ncbi:regulatory iron-sulfur-containing complex subunit RicT [Rubripirellula amarantea]|uniref:PSP1 C-terminal domain-containing protein n=1 Tax=Rubripirellula amarantea TaxID=2527999 RepID=A0A5C5WNM2_9BACT|nr:regulatory iron-sulfur-containing complex subunit RicT [Rubripirellula amarantea]MDA8743625.1 regulatory iron-sulfur-containing complex subunit RicT [Rubripirellula amarantea]TWT52426.1 hypothetical protein Pla22_00500 [Rubripirellula amarantea]
MNEPESVEDADQSAESSTPTQYVVRCGSMRTLGVMDAKESYRYRDEVVVRTERGTEIGTVLCEATPTAIDSMTEPTEGRILRRVSNDDRQQWNHLEALVADDMVKCQAAVDALRLRMELVDVERILGGERMVVYFLADQRVDFRQLVRDLGREFQTRIEMRQIGVRDEAKLLADYGDCGQPICCATFLTKMPPVSMKMAKLQKATLDPAKISGRCGRLKCCLRYEFDTYESLAEELPPAGSLVLTRDGNATVLGQNILARQLSVRMEDKRRILLHVDDIVQVLRHGEERSKSARKKSKRE